MKSMEDPMVERIEEDPEEEHVFIRSGQGIALKTKLLIGAALVGGIALGTVFFLFFLTAFIYFFVPIVIAFVIWRLFARR